MNVRLALPLLTLAMLGTSYAGVSTPAAAQTRPDQSVLGPGLDIFQTRIISATCGDASRTGHVRSYYGAVDGIPGSAEMTMRLVNSEHWPTWTLRISAEGNVMAEAHLGGVAGPGRPVAHFDLDRQPNKFAGRGTRRYRGQGGRQCVITYDALLRRIDLP